MDVLDGSGPSRFAYQAGSPVTFALEMTRVRARVGASVDGTVFWAHYLEAFPFPGSLPFLAEGTVDLFQVRVARRPLPAQKRSLSSGTSSFRVLPGEETHLCSFRLLDVKGEATLGEVTVRCLKGEVIAWKLKSGATVAEPWESASGLERSWGAASGGDTVQEGVLDGEVDVPLERAISLFAENVTSEAVDAVFSVTFSN